MKIAKKGYRVAVVLIYLIAIVAMTVLVSYSYFTATSSASGTGSFSTFAFVLKDDSDTYTATSITDEFPDVITPGETIEIDNMTIENTGSSKMYCLIKVVADVTKSGESTVGATFTKTYNLDGTEVGTDNSAQALDAEATETPTLSIVLTGSTLDNTYKNASVKLTITVGAVQYKNMPGETQTAKDQYASTYITTNCFA